MPTMVTFTSGNYASANPETVEKFKSAMEELLPQAEANIEDVKAVLPAFMNMPAEVAGKLKMEQYDAVLRTEQLTSLGELMLKYKFVEKAPDLQAMTVE